MRNTRRLEDKPFSEVNLHDSILLLRWKMFPKQSLKGRFWHCKILPKAHYFPQFSICSPVMDAMVANDTFRSDKASQLQTSPFCLLLKLQRSFTGYKLGSRHSKSSISLPGLVLKQNCHENVTKGTSAYCFVAISCSAEYKPNIFLQGVLFQLFSL